MEIFPIANEQDYDRALARIDELMPTIKRDSPEGPEFDALVTLVEAYENKHYPMGKPTPEGTIQVYMENAGLTRKDLEPMIGSRARVSEILSGKRPLTLNMIRRLHAGLGIPPEYLIGSVLKSLEQPLRRPASKLKKKSVPARRSATALRRVAS